MSDGKETADNDTRKMWLIRPRLLPRKTGNRRSAWPRSVFPHFPGAQPIKCARSRIGSNDGLVNTLRDTWGSRRGKATPFTVIYRAHKRALRSILERRTYQARSDRGLRLPGARRPTRHRRTIVDISHMTTSLRPPGHCRHCSRCSIIRPTQGNAPGLNPPP
jgi:hypothetical protein